MMSSLRYCDSQFKDFIKRLEKRKMLKNTVIILTADHGESFEHGFITHGGPYLHEEMTHIPLIIRETDWSGGKIIDDLVEQTDIPAIILELADIPVPSWIEGRSLVPLMRGEKLPQRPVFSMNFEKNMSRGHQITTGCISVREGDYKLMYNLDKDETMLFNLKHDPAELNNLIESEPEIGRNLLNLIRENLKSAIKAEDVFIKEDRSGISALAKNNKGYRVNYKGSYYPFEVFINGKSQSWIPYGENHSILGIAPALYHPDPKTGLVIGFGSGDTIYSMSADKRLEKTKSVELSGGQIELLKRES